MHMYIGNGTRQHVNFMYRLPETNKAREQLVRVGEQIKISGDLSQPDIDAIIDQWSKYGLVPVEEIDLKSEIKPTMCYQVGKPISPIAIKRLEMRNQGILELRGQEARKNAAIVMANELGSAMQRQQSDLTGFEVQVDEQATKGGPQAEDLIHESVVMQKQGAAPTPPRRSRRNR